MAFRSAPSQVFQHRQGCSLRHDKAEPFERRFELTGVDYTHRQYSFVDSDAREIAHVDGVVEFRVCGTEERFVGLKTESVSYAIFRPPLPSRVSGNFRRRSPMARRLDAARTASGFPVRRVARLRVQYAPSHRRARTQREPVRHSVSASQADVLRSQTGWESSFPD